MEFFALSLLGGVLAVEATSVGQFMLSRPVVAGVLAGWCLGAPAEGLVVGTFLELFTLSAFPIGGARLPEGGPATVVAVAVALHDGSPGALALAVAFGMAWSSVGGRSVVWLRRLNGRLAATPDALRPRARVARAVALSILVDGVRGTALTAAGLVLGSALVAVLASGWPLGRPATLGVLAVAASVSVGSLLSSLGGVRRRVGFVFTGLVLGGMGAWLL